MHANKLKLSKFFRTNEVGGGILQVLATMSFLFLVIYGMMTMLTNSRLAQKKQLTHSNLIELQTKLYNLLNDSQSWKNTIADASNINMACLRNNMPCVPGAKRIAAIRDSNNAIFIDNLPIWNTPGAYKGFTDSGLPCANFNNTPGNGSDLCPFSYAFIWEAQSNVIANSGLRITGRLLYNPGPNSANRIPIDLGTMTNNPAADVVAIALDDPTKKAVRQNGALLPNQIFDTTIGKYDISMWRTATTNVLSFRAVTTTSGVCSNAGVTRDGFTESYDPFDLIRIVGAPTAIRLRYSGTYECDGAANGNSVKGFSVQLLSGAAVRGAGTSFATVGNQSTAEFNTAFTINGLTDFTMQQTCELAGPPDALGSLAPDLTAVITSSLNCRLID